MTTPVDITVRERGAAQTTSRLNAVKTSLIGIGTAARGTFGGLLGANLLTGLLGGGLISLALSGGEASNSMIRLQSIMENMLGPLFRIIEAFLDWFELLTPLQQALVVLGIVLTGLGLRTIGLFIYRLLATLGVIGALRYGLGALSILLLRWSNILILIAIGLSRFATFLLAVAFRLARFGIIGQLLSIVFILLSRAVAALAHVFYLLGISVSGILGPFGIILGILLAQIVVLYLLYTRWGVFRDGLHQVINDIIGDLNRFLDSVDNVLAAITTLNAIAENPLLITQVREIFQSQRGIIPRIPLLQQPEDTNQFFRQEGQGFFSLTPFERGQINRLTDFFGGLIPDFGGSLTPPPNQNIYNFGVTGEENLRLFNLYNQDTNLRSRANGGF